MVLSFLISILWGNTQMLERILMTMGLANLSHPVISSLSQLMMAKLKFSVLITDENKNQSRSYSKKIKINLEEFQTN